MNIQRHLYLSSALRSPDDPAADVIDPVVDPAAVADPAAAAPAADPAVAELQPEPQAELQLEPSPAPPIRKEPTTVPLPVMLKRVGEVTSKLQAAEQREAATAQRAADLQAIIDRMAADPAAAPKPAAVVPSTTQDFAAAVKAQSARNAFDADCSAVAANWRSEAPEDFQQRLDTLAAVGALPAQDGSNTEFMLDVLAVANASDAHKILDKLAKDPEKAASLVGMDSRRRIAELTRMADAPKTEVKPVAPAAAAAPAISRAPAPKPAVSPLSAAAEVDPTTPEGNEKMSDREFERWYKDKYQKRA